jgi:5'(3')-deoxyribonucleotidase
MKNRIHTLLALKSLYGSVKEMRDLSHHFSANEGSVLAQRAIKLLRQLPVQTGEEREKVNRCFEELNWAIETASESYQFPDKRDWITTTHPVIQVEHALENFLYCQPVRFHFGIV